MIRDDLSWLDVRGEKYCLKACVILTSTLRWGHSEVIELPLVMLKILAKLLMYFLTSLTLSYWT